MGIIKEILKKYRIYMIGVVALLVVIVAAYVITGRDIITLLLNW